MTASDAMDTLGADRTHRVRLTARRVVGLSLGALALLTLFVVLDADLLGGIPRAVVAVCILSVLPGYLLLRIAGIVPKYSAEWVLYTVALSLGWGMVVGTVANFGLLAIGVEAPLRPVPLLVVVILTTLGLLFHYVRRVDTPQTLEFDPKEGRSPLVLGLALLPLVGIYGGLILTRYGRNEPLLLLYAAIAFVAILVALGRIPERYLPLTIGSIALALLLQNTLTGQFLAWGDQPKEAGLAMDVMRTGYWLPENAPAFGSKYAMLRIVILHPLYALLSDLKLVWVFKLVHPLLFSILPVALFQAYRRFTEPRIAFLSAFFYMSLFSFFVVLSRNTRTGTAILFLALLALLVADDSLRSYHRKLLALAFAAPIVVSHYGVSYMVLLAFAVGIAILTIGPRLIPRLRQRRPTMTTGVFVGFYVVVTFGWYLYASPGAKTFNMFVGFSRSFVNRLGTFLTAPGQSSATTRYVVSDFQSITIDILRGYNLLLGIVMGLGLLFAAYRVYTDRETVLSAEYFVYALVFFGVFGITFLPVERFNTARTYATTLVFFAPFLFFGIRDLYGRYGPSLDRTRDVLQGAAPAARSIVTVAVVAYFLLNVGFVSATVTNEYAPNALVEKDRIMADGAPVEKTYFYKQYHTVYGVASTDWLRTNAAYNSTVYQSGWPGGLQGAIGHQSIQSPPRNPNFDQRTIATNVSAINQTRLGEGYVYLNAYNVIGNVVRLPSGHFEFRYVRTDLANRLWTNKSLVYTNGGSNVYY